MPASIPRMVIMNILPLVYQTEFLVISDLPLISSRSSTNPKMAPSAIMPIGIKVCERLKKFNFSNKPEKLSGKTTDNRKNKKTERNADVQMIIPPTQGTDISVSSLVWCISLKASDVISVFLGFFFHILYL